MRPDVAVTEFLYAHDYAAKSRNWYDGMLTAFTAYCAAQDVNAIEDVTAPLVRRFLDAMRERTNQQTGRPIGSHTVHAYARAVRALLNWCAHEELLSEAVPRRLVMPRREQKVIQVLSAQQIDLLMRVAETTRDKAILAVLLDCGLRVNELCTLNLQNVHFTPQDAWLLVHGKRDKWREVGLGRKARRLLHTYIYRERHAPPNEAHVFLGKHGPLTASGIDQLLYRLRDEAGAEHFTGVRVSAHTMRHTFAVHYLSSGGELYKLSRLLGHTSVTTTDGYLRAFRARDARRNSESVLDSMW